MRAADKVKASIAASGMSAQEFSELCGISRQTLYFYFRPDIDMRDYPRGNRCIRVAERIWGLLESGVKKEALKETVRHDTFEARP